MVLRFLRWFTTGTRVSTHVPLLFTFPCSFFTFTDSLPSVVSMSLADGMKVMSLTKLSS